jgi:hypothetical protein
VARRAALQAAATIVVAAILAGAGSAGAATVGPVAMVGPTVIGTAAAGKQLTGLSGTWAGFDGITYHFQWFRCNAAGAACVSLHGATSPTYSLGNRDVGKTLAFTVYARDSTGTATAYSSLVGPIATRRPLLESTAQPVVTGPPVVGKVVQVTTGTWSPTPPTLAYRWERCNPNGRACAAIPAAVADSYTIVPADLGHALLAVVQATNGGTIQNAFSTATPAVVVRTAGGPTPTVGPTVAGSAIQGQQLVAQPGIWRGVGPIVFGYGWYRCNTAGGHCKLIPGASKNAYTTGSPDVGKTIGVTLSVADSIGKATAYASLVGPIAPARALLTPTAQPTIAGTARVGGTLSADEGEWSLPPRSYAYAWLRCNRNGRLCSAIVAADGASYRPTAADAGHTIVVEVTASTRGATGDAFTAATAPIVA